MEESTSTPRDNNPVVVFFTNLLSAIKLPPFPFAPNNNKNRCGKDHPPHPVAASHPPPPQEPIIVKPTTVEDESDKPTVLAFPKQTFPLLKLEAEADPEVAERTTNPLLLWQVYAIGGIFILRWAWKRWNEHKGGKKPDDEPPPRDD